MKRPRVSIAGLMTAVAAVAVDVTIVRTIFPQVDSEEQFCYLFGVLPMATLLILLVALSARNLLRGGRLPPFVFGFEAVGSVVVFIFISWYSIAPHEFAAYNFALLAWIASPFNSYLQESSSRLQSLVASGIATAVFSLPQLLLALLGGWVARKLELTVRLEHRGTQSKLTIP